MQLRALTEAAGSLFGLCVAVSMLELLAGRGGMARCFRSLCALAATLCAARVLAGLL